jgi:hypothetical protein
MLRAGRRRQPPGNRSSPRPGRPPDGVAPARAGSRAAAGSSAAAGSGGGRAEPPAPRRPAHRFRIYCGWVGAAAGPWRRAGLWQGRDCAPGWGCVSGPATAAAGAAAEAEKPGNAAGQQPVLAALVVLPGGKQTVRLKLHVRRGQPALQPPEQQQPGVAELIGRPQRQASGSDAAPAAAGLSGMLGGLFSRQRSDSAGSRSVPASTAVEGAATGSADASSQPDADAPLPSTAGEAQAAKQHVPLQAQPEPGAAPRPAAAPGPAAAVDAAVQPDKSSNAQNAQNASTAATEPSTPPAASGSWLGLFRCCRCFGP